MKTIIAISDTHNNHRQIKIKDKADIIVCSGDIVSSKNASKPQQTIKEIIDFIEWFSALDIKNKILISGNGDGYYIENNEEQLKELCKKHNIIYLKDEMVKIEDINFYGTPWTLEHNRNNGFTKKTEKELLIISEKIPEETDILITHTPPYGILDETNNIKCGSTAFLQRIKKLNNLKYHIFGHIHESRGRKKEGHTIYINSAYSNTKPYQIIKYNK